MKDQLKQLVFQLAEPLVKSHGLMIWGVEISGASPVRVRLYVDLPWHNEDSQGTMDERGSASIEQCEEISRELGLAMEVEDKIPGPWVLEVSSPGLDRRFFEISQLKSFIGSILDVSLITPIECGGSRKKLRGILLRAGSENFELEPCQILEDGRILSDRLPACVIQWDNCRLVKRVFVFRTPQKPGHGPRPASAR